MLRRSCPKRPPPRSPPWTRSATAALPTPPEAPGHQDGPVLGRGAVLDEAAQRQQRGEAGQPDDGGVAAAQCVGQRHHPVGRHPRVGGEAAVAGHAEVVALHEHPLAGGEVGARALLHAAGQLDPGDEREAAGHAVPRPRHHGVLEVDGGPLDPDEHVARRQVGVRELDHRGPDDRARLGEQVGRESHGLTVEGAVVWLRARAAAPGTFGPWSRLQVMGVGPRRSHRPTSPGPRSPSRSCAPTATPSTGSSRARPSPVASCWCGPVPKDRPTIRRRV